MGAKKPIGLYAGEFQQFQAGDFLDYTQGGTGSTTKAGARTNLGLEIGTDVQAQSAELSAVAALASTGVLVRTGAGAYAQRQLAGTAGRIAVANPTGVAGNPTIDLVTLTDAGGGSFKKIATDAYGRVAGTSNVAAGDITALVDSVYGRLDGATFTGSLKVAGNASNALEAVPLQQLTAAIGGITSGATGGGGDRVFIENDTYVTTSYRLGAGDMKVATISIANPAVITMANTFVADQPIQLDTSGALPAPLDRGNQYFVLAAGLSGASFQISATKGGAAISTVGGSQSGTHKVGKIKNAFSTGPISGASTATISGPNGSRWVGA